MKNFILLFLSCFALTWVGCEKETITPATPISARTVLPSKQYNVTQVGFEQLSEYGQIRSEEVCCTIFDDLFLQDFTTDNSNPRVEASWFFTGSMLNMSSLQDPRVRARNFVNDVFYSSLFDESSLYQCDSDEPVAHYVEVDLPIELFDYCPYTVRVDVTVEGVDENGDFKPCARKILRASAESFFLPEGQNCGSNSGDCFDDNGQPVPCFG